MPGSTTTGVAPLLDFSLGTLADARQALPVLKEKIKQLSLQRGEIGAFASRLQSALNTTSISSENIAAASSRIKDVDVARETANLVKSRMLQQAGSAIMAQANQ